MLKYDIRIWTLTQIRQHDSTELAVFLPEIIQVNFFSDATSLSRLPFPSSPFFLFFCLRVSAPAITFLFIFVFASLANRIYEQRETAALAWRHMHARTKEILSRLRSPMNP